MDISMVSRAIAIWGNSETMAERESPRAYEGSERCLQSLGRGRPKESQSQTKDHQLILKLVLGLDFFSVSEIYS